MNEKTGFTKEEFSNICKLQRQLDKRVRLVDNNLRCKSIFNHIHFIVEGVVVKRNVYFVFIYHKDKTDISLQSWILYKEQPDSHIIFSNYIH